MDRRSSLKAGAAAIGGLATTVFVTDIFVGGYEITDARYEGQLLGPTKFIFIVENSGGSLGDAEVKLELFEDEVLLESASKVVSVPAGQSREVTIEMEVPEDANTYDASATLDLPF